MMFKTGLCSITFRKLSIDEIISLSTQAGIDGIEWGGDVHVPHGDLDTARFVAEATRAAGLEVSSYGSYYRLGRSEDERLNFQTVLDTALALGAPMIRVWPGTHGSADTLPEHREQIESELRRIATQAAEADIQIGLEYHYNTLTDSLESTLNLLKAVDHPNLTTYWQPWFDRDRQAILDEIPQLLPYLSNLHVYSWESTDTGWNRLALSDKSDFWTEALSRADQAPGDRWAILEFVRDDKPEQFLHDATTLREMI
jgi:3-dehydroshikimate dehydratase